MDFLVGNTGFVGSNLVLEHDFDGQYHSSNIMDAYGKKPELLVYAGVRAEMFLANQNPESDFHRIEEAIHNIIMIEPKECILISSVAVYPDTHDADEDTVIQEDKLGAYGKNRLYLERWVESNIENSIVIRLPAIFGKNLKKNFLYDYIHLIPPMLSEAKMKELQSKEPCIREYYTLHSDGFWRCRRLVSEEERTLKNVFRKLNFSALHFSDSRSVYQFYSLKNLWLHIEIARQHKLRRLNLVTPPVSVAEVYHMLSGDEFHNELAKAPFSYDLRTKYDSLFGHNDGYIMDREEEMRDIMTFVREEGGLCR